MMTYHLTSITVATIKKIDNSMYWLGYDEIRIVFYCW